MEENSKNVTIRYLMMVFSDSEEMLIEIISLVQLCATQIVYKYMNNPGCNGHFCNYLGLGQSGG